MRPVERVGLFVFRRLARRGSLELTLPSGESVVIGDGMPSADLQISSYSALRDIVQRGLIGFAEGYMSGLLDTKDLPGLLTWGVANQEAWFEHPITRWTLPIRRIFQKIVPERRHARVQTMNDHYNLGNRFYEEWLDETMTYSSARFETPDQDLAEAQRNKYRSMAAIAGLQPGMRVLEIGCGWGSFAAFAASELGCDVVAITLSEEQGSYAKDRIEQAGLTDKVDIRIQDFRDITGQFDAVVSIEMIESIDETQWPDLFAKISESLPTGGRAAMQIITISDSEWARYRSRADFIQQYIFPGGQLPAPMVLRGLARGSGLDVDKVETFGLDYARTLRAWRARFDSKWEVLRIEHDLDDRFWRMWDLYLSLCDAGFRTGRIDVEQWAFEKRPTDASLSAPKG